MTKYEKKIYEIIGASQDHLNAEQIFEMLKQVYPTVVFATVYNNLNKLWKAGLVRKISLEGKPDRYDRIEKHDHLLCKQCGKLLDINLADLTEQLQQQIDIPLLSYDLRLIYLCDDCQRKRKGEE
ncbi:Fur family transcriptional regulator [Youxingia wuxianensis]|uniref:Transcriptional repressor n=1 Tax=Youxingia wuxianensis TaxID=2763678 RepID=A0A926ERA5_9FIRM|nr:transcriptional repressor [Youxingia wuxianensis]MBC8585992.1 transcriptional repressor [Youxingia wuxianensis]